MEDYEKTRGPLPSSRPDAGGANLSTLPVIGIVKDNIDPVRAGRIRVFLTNQASLNVDPDDADNWQTVSYLSSFFGSVRPTSSSEGFGEYKSNGSSYGEWHAPPDIGTKVVCIFIEGKPDYGFYIGCIPDAESLYMVPAIGSAENFVPNDGEAEALAGAERAPVTNINLNDKEVTDTEKFLNHPRPVHSYSTAIMSQQGIIRDPVRGPISSSSQREAASRVGWGVSTPGRPIYQGGLSDLTVTENLDPSVPGNAEKLRVISRRGGHSIVMDDGDLAGRDQLIRLRTALGHQILMSDDGQTLMLLHSNGQSYIELGAEGTVDVYASNSINMRTDGDINFHAKRDINFHSNSSLNLRSDSIHFDSLSEIKMKAEEAFKISTLGNFTVKSGSTVAIDAGNEASLKGASDTYIVGAKVNLNSGESGTQPEEVEEIPLKQHPDTVFDESKGFISSPGLLETIVSRAPAHAPWAEAGKGVDVPASFNSADNLPASSSSAVSGINQAASAVPSTAASLGTVSSAPSSQLDTSIGSDAAPSAIAAVATSAASTAQSAVQFGASLTEGAGGNPALGAFAQTPSQLADAGVIKPGSDKLVNTVASVTGNLEQAMPGSIFSGKSGVSTVGSLLSNPPAQAAVLAENFQKSKQTLTMAGAISGKEAPEQITGIVAAGAVHGAEATVGALQAGASGTPTQSESLLKTVGSVTNTVGSAIKQGAVGGIASLVTGGSASSGFKKSAFNSVKDSLISKISGVPNVNPPKSIPGISGGVSGVIANLAGSASQVATGLVNSSAVSKASGLSNLPGGVSGAVSQVDLSSGASSAIAGISGVSGLISQGVSAALNNLPIPSVLGKAGALESLAKGALSSAGRSALDTGLSALSSVKGSKRAPIAAVNTLGREILSNQVDAVLSDLVVRAVAPKFDQSLEEREEEIETAEQAIAEREEAARKASEFKRDLSEVAEKYREERLSALRNTEDQEQDFSIGSPERISAIRQQIAVLENSPHRENGLKIIEEALSFARSTGDQSFEREIEKRKALFKGSEFNAEVNRLRRKLNQELAETNIRRA